MTYWLQTSRIWNRWTHQKSTLKDSMQKRRYFQKKMEKFICPIADERIKFIGGEERAEPILLQQYQRFAPFFFKFFTADGFELGWWHTGEGQHGVDVNMVILACVGRMDALFYEESEWSLASSLALYLLSLYLYDAERSFKRSRRSCLSRCTWPSCCSTKSM